MTPPLLPPDPRDFSKPSPPPESKPSLPRWRRWTAAVVTVAMAYMLVGLIVVLTGVDRIGTPRPPRGSSYRDPGAKPRFNKLVMFTAGAVGTAVLRRVLLRG